MLDLDYKNKSNDYILEMFFGIEEDELYIGLQYKDGTVSKVPFNIRNYNIITARIERQFYKYASKFLDKKIIDIGVEKIKMLGDYLIMGFAYDTIFSNIDNKIISISIYVVLSCLVGNIVLNHYEKIKLASKEKRNLLLIKKYLSNKEKFLIELPDGESFYGVNIANINCSVKNMPTFLEYMQNEEIKGQIKALRLSYEEEQK